MKSPYPAMIQYVLTKYPDMRFQDAFVDGNDWSKGNDRYRDDHPVMQFVARQLQLMNSEGLTRKDAFDRTREEFHDRRLVLEKRQKIEMALAANQRVVPAFGSPQYPNPLYNRGSGVARQREAQLEILHLNHVRRRLRQLRKEIEPHDRRRMSAKEIALDVEAERVSLLGRLPPSRYTPPPEPPRPSAPVMKSPVEEEEEEEEVEFLSPSEEDEEETLLDFVDDNYESESVVYDPEIFTLSSGRKPRPLDPALPRLIPTDSIFSAPSISQPRPTIPAPTREQSTVLSPRRPADRPDRIQFNEMALRRRMEREKMVSKIGPEPGAENELDFEDFVLKNRK